MAGDRDRSEAQLPSGSYGEKVNDMIRFFSQISDGADPKELAEHNAQRDYLLDQLQWQLQELPTDDAPLEERLQQPITDEQRRKLIEIFQSARSRTPGGAQKGLIPNVPVGRGAHEYEF